MTAGKKEKEGWRGEMIAVLRQSASTSFELPEFKGPSVRSRTLPLRYPAKRRSSSSRSFLPYTLLPTYLASLSVKAANLLLLSMI